MHCESTSVTQWERNVQRQIDPLVITLRDIVGNHMQSVLSSKDTQVKSFDGKVLNIILQNTILYPLFSSRIREFSFISLII